MRVAFLGTGLMGAPMVRRLAEAGHDLTVWNRSRDRAEALSDVATVADRPAEAAAGADAVISMLLDGPVTASVLEGGVLDAAAPGALVLNMGSVDPATDRRLGGAAAARGLRYLDAPVSGGVAGAEAGSLVILVGGEAADFEAAREVFRPMGRATHLGPLGAGQVCKLANQLIVGTTIGAVAEALRLAEAAGCDPAALREALRGGFADSRILEVHGQRMVTGKFEPGGRSDVQLKDLNNVQAAAAELGLDLPLGATVRDAYRDLVELGLGARDHSAYYLWLKERRSGAAA